MPYESQLYYNIYKFEENEKLGYKYGDADPFYPLSADNKLNTLLVLLAKL